jgi:hypothetical protein
MVSVTLEVKTAQNLSNDTHKIQTHVLRRDGLTYHHSSLTIKPSGLTLRSMELLRTVQYPEGGHRPDVQSGIYTKWVNRQSFPPSRPIFFFFFPLFSLALIDFLKEITSTYQLRVSQILVRYQPGRHPCRNPRSSPSLHFNLVHLSEGITNHRHRSTASS